MTHDIDAVVMASSAMKDAISRVADKRGLPSGWLNTDFKRTKSYSDKLIGISVHYRTFSNILTIRTVSAEYLVAMKLMSGRRYKHDLSDIVGILWEHQKSGNPLSRESIEKAITTLYGDSAEVPSASRLLTDSLFERRPDYEAMFMKIIDSEKESKDLLLSFDENYPNALNADNTDGILDLLRKRQGEERAVGVNKKSLIQRLNENKKKIEDVSKHDNPIPSSSKPGNDLEI